MAPFKLEMTFTLDEVIQLIDAAIDTPGFGESQKPTTRGRIIDLIDKVFAKSPKQRRRRNKADTSSPATTEIPSPGLAGPPRRRGRPRKTPDATPNLLP